MNNPDNNIKSAKEFINQEDIKTLGLARAMVAYAAQFQTQPAPINSGKSRTKEECLREALQNVHPKLSKVEIEDIVNAADKDTEGFVKMIYEAMQTYANQGHPHLARNVDELREALKTRQSIAASYDTWRGLIETADRYEALKKQTEWVSVDEKRYTHFERKDGKYIADDGSEITVEYLMSYPHWVYHDDGFIMDRFALPSPPDLAREEKEGK